MKDGMKDIFTELYNKVMSFFIQQEEVDPTKNLAINRLKTVLMQDRVGFSERAIQSMKEEMLECIAKYMEIDEDSFNLQIDANENATILNLSIPVLRARDDEEIDAIVKQKEERTQIKAEEIVLELEEMIKDRAKSLAKKIAEEGEEILDEISDENENEEENTERSELEEKVEEKIKEKIEAAKEESEEEEEEETEDSEEESEEADEADEEEIEEEAEVEEPVEATEEKAEEKTPKSKKSKSKEE
ncbi:cell division topological specificity factor MinE [bacterium]|nr:cell division topological specificity factor MinE [bacterium]